MTYQLKKRTFLSHGGVMNLSILLMMSLAMKHKKSAMNGERA